MDDFINMFTKEHAYFRIQDSIKRMLDLEEKYKIANILRLFSDIFTKYDADIIRTLYTRLNNQKYTEEIIVNCLKLLQYGLSINELTIITDYISCNPSGCKFYSKMQDNQQKPDFLKHRGDLKSILFNPDELPKLNEILYYVYIYESNSELVNDKIYINLKPYIETKYFNVSKNENWFFTDGKIINDNSKTNIILNHYYCNIFKIYYEFDDEFIISDNQIIINHDEIQKLNNYKIKIKFSLVDFASSFITEFMAFKYSLPHEYIIYNDEITHDKCDDIIMKKIIDYNKSKVFGNIELYGYFENNNGIELGGIYLQPGYYNNESSDGIEYFTNDKDWKCFEFDVFIKSVSDIVVKPKPKKLEEKIQVKIEQFTQQESEDDEETVSVFSDSDD